MTGEDCARPPRGIPNPYSQPTPGRAMPLFRQPLIRLLAINLAAGLAVAALLLGGLLALNPGNLRGLLFADRLPGAALGLLAFGFFITFGSAAMGSAIMMLGKKPAPRDGGGKVKAAKAAEARVSARG
jgi:hypothetical protein